ncbi:hypothetical protein GCM10023205_22360 [Yinghuangia aomiensis]|uniref:Bartonella effector protein BID domain-containing protein n=1 Tax=Yinghuangia aomiensis TaxID=676205 RepID=A0ABP9H4F8_9ACTN
MSGPDGGSESGAAPHRPGAGLPLGDVDWTWRPPPLEAVAPGFGAAQGRITVVRGHEQALRQAGSGPDGVPLLVRPPAGADPAALMAAYGEHLERERDGVLTQAIVAVKDAVVQKTRHYLTNSSVFDPSQVTSSMQAATLDVAGRVTAAAFGRSSDAGAQPGLPRTRSRDHTWAAAEIDAKEKVLGRSPGGRHQMDALKVAVELGGLAAAAREHVEISRARGDTVAGNRSAEYGRQGLAEAEYHAGLAAESGRRGVKAYADWLTIPGGARATIDLTRGHVGQAAARLDRVAAGLSSATDMKAARSPVSADAVNGAMQNFTIARAFSNVPALAAELVPGAGRSPAG